MTSDGILMVFVTTPDAATAESLSRALVDARLAACANRVPNVGSTFHWQGAIETSTEHLLILKTTVDAYPQLEQAILSLHPYSCPEVLAVPVVRAQPAYAAWVRASVAPKPPATAESDFIG